MGRKSQPVTSADSSGSGPDLRTDGPLDEQGLVGLKFLKRFQPLLARLRDEGTQRDQAGNRRLFMDQLCGLILLTYFNPCVKSLRNLHQASQLAKVRKQLGCQTASLGALSEAMHLFDSQRLVPIVEELLGELPDASHHDPQWQQLKLVPTAVDGTFLKQLPQITQACFATRRDRGWKLHTHFEVFNGRPVRVEITDGSGRGPASETASLERMLERDRCYIVDRGYEKFALFNAIVAADSGYVARVRNDHEFTVRESRELSAEATAAGVLRDEIGRQGSERSQRIDHPDHEQRRIEVRVVEHVKRGGRRRRVASQNLILVTNLLDVPVEMVVMLYRYRWLIELFFRWLKCVMSCRHLMSQVRNGIEIQIYCALIAFLLTQLAAGRSVRPTTWTYKLLCLFAQGWATEAEVLAHLRDLERQAALRAARG